jgi:N-acetylmuramoyl-L-alanine amidase
MQWLINLIISLFTKDNQKPEVSAPKLPESPKPNIPSGAKKIAILVGHGAGDSGAICWNKMEEHEYNKKASSIILDQVKNKELKVFFKTKNGWGSTYAQVALFHPDICIEMHLNAATGTAYGCEVLITSESARSIGELFASRFCEKFQRRIRGSKGIKWLKSGDRGFGNVYAASKVSKKAILIEPFFCDNKTEWIEVEEYAKFLVDFINEL